MESIVSRIYVSVQKSVRDFNDNIVAYLAASCLFLILFVLLLILNDSFTTAVTIEITDIYEMLVNSYQTGGSVDIEQQLISAAIYFLFWVLEFFGIVLLVSMIFTETIFSEKKLAIRHIMISIAVGVACGMVVAVFRLLGDLFPLDFVLVFAVVTSFSLLFYQIKWVLAFRRLLKLLVPLMAWTIFYFVLVVSHFLLAIILLKLTGSDPYLRFGWLLSILLVSINLLFIHGYFCSFGERLSGNGVWKSILYSFRLRYIFLSIAWFVAFIVFLVVLALMAAAGIPYFPQIVFAAGLSIGVVLYVDSITKVAKTSSERTGERRVEEAQNGDLKEAKKSSAKERKRSKKSKKGKK